METMLAGHEFFRAGIVNRETGQNLGNPSPCWSRRMVGDAKGFCRI